MARKYQITILETSTDDYVVFGEVISDTLHTIGDTTSFTEASTESIRASTFQESVIGAKGLLEQLEEKYGHKA